MPQRTPPEVLDAIAETCHQIMCMSSRDGDRGHDYKAHSGTGYRDLGKQLMTRFEAAGYEIRKVKK